MSELPPGYAAEWTGIAFQQKMAGSTAGLVFGLAVLFVFLVPVIPDDYGVAGKHGAVTGVAE